MIKYYKLALHQEEVSSGAYGPNSLSKISLSKISGNSNVLEIAKNQLEKRSIVVEKARYSRNGPKLKKNMDTDVILFEALLDNYQSFSFNKKVFDNIIKFCDEYSTIVEINNLYVEAKNPVDFLLDIYMLIQKEYTFYNFINFEESEIFVDVYEKESFPISLNSESYQEFIKRPWNETKQSLFSNKLVLNEAPHIFSCSEFPQTRRLLFSEEVLKTMESENVTGFYTAETNIFAKKIQDKKYGL